MNNPQTTKTHYKHRFRNLLFFLLVYIFGSPFLAHYPSLVIVAHTSLTVALCFSVYAVQKAQKHRTIAMILLIPVIFVYWLGVYDLIPFSRQGSYLLFVIYYGLLAASFVTQITHFKKVTANVIYATLCLYLVIGLFWGALYALLYEIIPGSYSGVLLDNAKINPIYIFNYFSMVTLTTLGYGDITPQTPGAGSLCQLEAIVGQFFIAVFVAWLVGQFVGAQRQENQDE